MTRPTVRAQLGAELKQLRASAGLSGAAVARELGCDQSRVSRIEAGKTRVSPDDVAAWLRATGAPADVHDRLLGVASRAEVEVTSWHDLHAQGWTAHQRAYDELEAEAKVIRLYQPAVVPGLLQTSSYAAHLLREVVGVGEDEIGAAVSARLKRQELLYRPTTHLDVIVTEAVLRTRMGGAAIMLEQLQRIAQLAKLPTVDLGVIPLATDMPASYGTSHDVCELPTEGESVVIVELATQEVRENHPDVIAQYQRLHSTYRAASVTGTDAVALVEGIASELTDELFPSS